MCHLGSFVLMHTLLFLSLYNLHYCSILQRSSVRTCCSFILSYIVCIAERRPALIGYLTHIFRLPDHLLRVKPHKRSKFIYPLILLLRVSCCCFAFFSILTAAAQKCRIIIELLTPDFGSASFRTTACHDTYCKELQCHRILNEDAFR